ncbi:MAG: PAS domain-containing protein, partial [Actinoplanes sp.]
MDDHAADYWARQLRIGASVASVVTAIGALRIGLEWDAGRRWWLIPVLLAVLAQAAMLLLPWSRLVRNDQFRSRLRLWWWGEIPVLFLFGWADPAGWLLYVPAVVLLLVTAAALWSPRMVIWLGAFSIVSYGILLPVRGGANAGTTMVLVAMMACVVGLTAVYAQSRRKLDHRRRTAELRTETILVASADTVLAVGRDERLKYVSPSLRRLLGYSPEEMTGAK